MEEFRTDTPLEKRKSQNLNFWDFAKDKLFWQYLPLIAPAIGFGIGRLRGRKGIFPLDGSPSILYKLQEATIFKVFGKNEELKKEPLRLYTEFFYPGDDELATAKRLALQKDLWNIIKTLEITSIPLAFHLWRNKQSKKLDLEDACGRLEKISYVKPTSDELRAENASLAQQLAFVEGTEKGTPEKPTQQTANMNYDGKLHAGLSRENSL